MRENLLTFFYFINKLYQDRSVIWTMVLRDLKSRYIGSLFGFFWSIIDPLFLVFIYWVVFGLFFNSKPDPVYGTDSFIIFLLSGILPWQFFSQSVIGSTGVILSNRNLIKKSVGFPSEILPLIKILTNVISHFVGILILIFLIGIDSGLPPLFPVFLFYMGLTVILAMGMGWILSSINVYLRDMQQMVGLLMMGWFFFTPIFYSPARVPEAIMPFYKLNPMYHIVTGYRYALLTGTFLPVFDMLYITVLSVVLFGSGGILFRKLKPGFAEVL